MGGTLRTAGETFGGGGVVKHIRPRIVSDGAADRGTSGHGVQKSPAGLGHPNKHFCGAKMASVATLALLAVSAFP